MLFFYCFFGFFRNVETQIEEALSCFHVFMAYFCFMFCFFKRTRTNIYTQTHKLTKSQPTGSESFPGMKGSG